jgi:hypothetical protein
MKILETEFDVANYSNEEIIRIGFALTGDALMVFNDRAGQPKLEAVIEQLESDLHLSQEEKEELQMRVEELEDEILELKGEI